MTLHHPLQKLCIVPSQDSGHQLLLAASGPTINCISLSEGSLLHQWPTQRTETDDSDNCEIGESPSKKRKLESHEQNPRSRQQSEASDASVEIVAERRKGERKKSKFVDSKLPNVSHLLAASDGKHVLAVTAEDKAIRVFRISSKGKLIPLSQRLLPKKLCAVRLSQDEKTILAADKFGDVYAVPLHPSDGWIPSTKPETESVHRPAATELTVHTKGNLEALKQQQVQKFRHQKKEGPDFEYQLLLGHVSLLTDLILAEGVVDGRRRPFILTSDRDEHIRVSRGLPQAHIIENFCLGHHEFVTKLCIPLARPDLLIAGDGEPSLRLYEWQTGTLKQTVQVTSSIVFKDQNISTDSVTHPPMPEGRSYDKLAISGIWSMCHPGHRPPDEAAKCLILVAIEGLPLLIAYTLGPESLSEPRSIQLPGNVLDVIVLQTAQQVLVSVDNVHKPFSMKSYREQHDTQAASLHLFQLSLRSDEGKLGDDVGWKMENVPFDDAVILGMLPEVVPVAQVEDGHKNKGYEKLFSHLGEFLYGLENLRKKRGLTNEEDDYATDVEAFGELRQDAPEET